MRRIIIYILAGLSATFPMFQAALYGSDWGEFFVDLAGGFIIAFLLCTIANLIGRVEKLEDKDREE